MLSLMHNAYLLLAAVSRALAALLDEAWYRMNDVQTML